MNLKSAQMSMKLPTRHSQRFLTSQWTHTGLSSWCDNLDFADGVTLYITFCVHTVIPSKENAIFPNNKPLVNKEVNGIKQ